MGTARSLPAPSHTAPQLQHRPPDRYPPSAGSLLLCAYLEAALTTFAFDNTTFITLTWNSDALLFQNRYREEILHVSLCGQVGHEARPCGAVPFLLALQKLKGTGRG